MKKIIIFIESVFVIALCSLVNFKAKATTTSFSQEMNVYDAFKSIKEIKNVRDQLYMIIDDNNGIYVPIEITNIYTPNSTVIESYNVLGEMANSRIEYNNSYYPSHYSGIQLLYTSTAYFNCHSYAWYSQDVTTNHIWLNDPSQFYYDLSYQEVTIPRDGDIICYFKDCGEPNYFHDDENLHSGIVVSYDSSIIVNNVCGNSNQVVVESKWGDAGLYRHAGDSCPYAIIGDYVKYYRPRTHDSVTLSNPTTNTLEVINKSHTVTNGSSNSTNYAMFELNVASSKQYTFICSSNHSLNVVLYDSYMHPINITLNNNSSGNNYSYVINNKYLTNGCYYIRISYTGNNTGTINMTVHNQHSHTNEYEWVSLTAHRRICSCNELEAHVISYGDFINGVGQYARCILCHGLASFGGTIHPESINSLPKTINGSFILPNGTIVLVDEDLESYIDGTLQFYSQNIDETE